MDRKTTIKENHIFRRLYHKGKSAVQPAFVVYCSKNRTGTTRLGITVSVKLGGAVVRNRARRRIREMHRLSRHKIKSGYDIVIVARSRVLRARFSALLQQYDAALEQLSVREVAG